MNSTPIIHRRRLLIASLLGLGLPSINIVGGEPFRHACRQCGCQDAVQKVCRLVREDKKVQVTLWGSKEEDFCLPGPSCPQCEHSELVCGNCHQSSAASKQSDDKAKQDKPKDENVLTRAKRFVWTNWNPGDCGEVFTRKKLMKKTITKTVPGYKWVVEDLCTGCQSICEPEKVPVDVTIPAPPKAAGTKILEPVRGT